MSQSTLVLALKAPFIKGKALDFSNKVFDETLDISSLLIGNVDFTGCHFKGKVIAKKTQFLGLCWFKNCIFEQGADFSNALFHSDATFNGSQFRSSISLQRAEIRGTTRFENAIITGKADFNGLEAFGNISLQNTCFEQTLHFRDVHAFGGLWIEGATFNQGYFNGTEVHGRTLLRGSQNSRFFQNIESYGIRQQA